MKRIKSRIVLCSTVVLLAMGGISCTSAKPTSTPGVDEMGEFIRMEQGKDLEVVVGYRFAAGNLGSEWLILEVAMTTPFSDMTEVKRSDVWIETPDGETIPLATQKEFNESYSELRPLIHRANVARDPMNYFPASRKPCRIQFFVTPGGGMSYDTVTLNYKRGCMGKFFFKVPGGVGPGTWTLGIDLENSQIKIPFELGK